MNLDLLSFLVGLAVGGAGAYALWQSRQKLKQEMASSFQLIAAQAMQANNSSLVSLANSQLAVKEQSFRELVAPIQQRLQELDRSQHNLTQQLTGLSGETNRLVQALRTPHVRGRWGEVQLKRVVELAGMIEHCDFDPQVVADNGRRPDLVVKLPAGKCIAIDAKTPLEAYLRAMEEPTDEGRKAAIAHHARQVREHIRQLGAKSYWEQFKDSPEFVVLFLPGENFFAAALEAEPDLIEAGNNERVVLATPTTLIALLRAVHYGWRQEKLSETAREIATQGQELYDRLETFSKHLGNVGGALDKAVEHYNKAMGSYDSRVMVGARKLKELGVVESTRAELPVKIIDTRPRLPHNSGEGV